MSALQAVNPHAGHLAATLIAGPGVPVAADDLGTPADCITLHLGELGIIGSLSQVSDLVARASAQLFRLDVERQLSAEHACTYGGHSHPLSLLEDLGDGRSSVECTACHRSFVQEGDGTLVPIVDGVVPE